MKRLLLCAALLVWSGMASAIVYKWTDAQGKTQYGDRPPDGVHAEIVDMPGSHAARSVLTTRPSPSAKSPARDLSTTDDAAKKAVADDVAQIRGKQCSDAQERYKKLLEGRRLYKAGADGERQYLSSEEIDSERINAKREVDTICNASS